MAVPVSAFISGVISGYVIEGMNGYLQVRGWQWLYLYLNFRNVCLKSPRYIIEGVPTVALGVVTLALLPNSPADAKFLTEQEKIYLSRQHSNPGTTRGKVLHTVHTGISDAPITTQTKRQNRI